jgi:hypothetical protein
MFAPLMTGLHFVDAPLSAAGKALFTPSPLDVELAQSEARTGVDFGYVSGSVSGYAYVDANRNGARDPGEPGIGGVAIALGGDTTASTTTDADGSYFFAPLVAGNYSTSSAPTAAGRALSTPSPLDATLSEGQMRTELNFGYVPGGLSGFAYVDSNRNGMRDPGEAGLGGVAISMAGGATGTTNTASDGSYSFSSLLAGGYTITAPATAAGRQLFTTNPLAVSLAAGELRPNVNFGYVPGGISGFAYADSNGNGVRDSGEPGLANVTITLGPGGATTTTASNGSYGFSSLVAGSYTVSAPSSTGGLTRSTPSPLNVSLAAGEQKPDVDFGYVTVAPSCPPTTFATGWSSTKAGAFSPAYLALYSMGLGVTDNTEGDGSNNRHTVDNKDQNNYVVMAFSQPVAVDQIYLGYVVGDSDIRVWIGTIPNAFTSGVTLNQNVLNNLTFTEVSLGGSATRWADINAGMIAGNVLVVAAKPDETTDYVKIDKVLVSCPAGAAPLQLSCMANNTGTVGTAFSSSLTVTGGTSPYTFSVLSGNLPGGLTLNTSTGAITGTPTAAGTFNFTAKVVDSGDGSAQTDTTSCGITVSSPQTSCTQTTLTFTGNTALDGPLGNIRSYSMNGVSVKVSAFSRSNGGSWSPAYLGVWNQGFGVTASTEDGTNGTHRVDNVGGTNNYVLFEFSSPVIVDYAYLNSVVDDSDMSAWVGTFNNPYTNHMTLNDTVLNNFAVRDDDDGPNAANRWAHFNEGRVSGNALVISASRLDTTPDDWFKVNKLYVCK